jgi:hypothetical protein
VEIKNGEDMVEWEEEPEEEPEEAPEEEEW